MTAGVVTVGRKQYAVGLYWENSPSGRISQAAKEAARQSATPADFYVTRPGSEQGRVPQFGLAPRNKEFFAGMPSLTGCLAVQQPGSWIGAFRFREGVALSIVRDDLIVPDGDLFFVDESEARDRLFEEIAIGGFHRVYAPEPWGVPTADTMPISLLLNDKTTIKLRSVAISPKNKAILTIAGSLLVLSAGMGFYIQSKIEQQEEAVREQMIVVENARKAAENLILGQTKEPVYPPPERKWEKRPDPLQVVAACQEALQGVDVGLAGWKLSGLRCDETSLSISWGRQKGFSEPPPKGTVEDKGLTATRVIPLKPLSPRGEEALVDSDTVMKRYLGQNWTGSIARIADDPPPPRPPEYTEQEWAPPAAPWVKRSFTLSVPVLPWTVTEFLSGLPGVIVKTLTQSGSQTEWTIEGEIYENRR